MVVRVTFQQVFWGQSVQNVQHFEDLDGTTADAQNLGALLVSDWVNIIRTQQVNQLRWTQIMVQEVSPNLGQSFITPINIMGAISTSSTMPTFAALIITTKAAFGGRNMRGRMYVSGLKQDGINSGIVEANYLTAWQAIAQQLKGHWAVGGTKLWTWCLSRRSQPSDTQHIVQVNAQPRLGVQRRRNVGVGI